MSGRATAAMLTAPVTSSDHAQGSEAAPVTLVEYGDYECSHCGAAAPIVQALQKRMGKALRFVFRNFPLKESHPHATHAAIAAEAVGAHGEARFWAMHDSLYVHQTALEDQDLERYAEATGVPAPEIAQAFRGGPFADRVRGDFRGGVRSGVNGTPTFFINGTRFDGDWRDSAAFLAVLQSAAEAPR
jgi:protein-disulfide isomerase